MKIITRNHYYSSADLPAVGSFSYSQQVNFVAFVGCPKAKKLSASWGLRPPGPLTRGSAPGPRWGPCPQTPFIGSRSRARHGRLYPGLAD